MFGLYVLWQMMILNILSVCKKNSANKFADYFERWWKQKYEMWMVCVGGIARDIMDINI